MSGKPAARLSDPTTCPVPGHGTPPIQSGSPDVQINGLPAARLGDLASCGQAISGAYSATVFINGKNAATVGSTLSHGGVVIGGGAAGGFLAGLGVSLICGPGAPVCAIAVVLAGSAVGGVAGSMAAGSLDDEFEEFSKWEAF